MSIAITKNEQLVGLLTGAWSAEADAAFRVMHHRDLLTVKRAEILDYLRDNPRIARDYLNKWEAIRPAADINIIWAEGGGYKVAWMTWDGKPWETQDFENLNEAVVEHVCRHNGIKD